MDSITHLAIGACMGEAFAGKKLGKKAMLWGAIAHSIPDIDFVSSFWMTTPSALLAHRGFTHSFVFCAIAGTLFALLAWRWHRQTNIPFWKWALFFGTVIFLHVFIDAFNNYGVGWFEPFSHCRITFNAIYVADPLFSIWPGIACIALIFISAGTPPRKKWWQMGLGLSGLYLVYCLFNKNQADTDLKSILQKQHISYTRYFTTPAPMQNLLWFVVAGNNKGYYVGFHSLLDSKKIIAFQYFPRNDSLLNTVRSHRDVQQLIRFSKQFYTVEKWRDSLVFNDLRFGQVMGWENPKGKFVFHYFLQSPQSNKMVVQRGRLEGWNWRSVQSFWKRIRGN
ncbi:metal-dependent hydrolase [Mucilaginibacter gotjawali]|uniref:Inner membrane protein n=2 Tax=Mucilaginibacter gotjawali TaxID=1550579 RepID=A0A839S9U1_9SPHI|nr:metal-dependent hydrolase [Mucilaginibacter gotjawali]MBB3054013.1 inner membrane protein [Mucilaginibacter gotjawali]BAU54278.1 Inner membrane protein YbcI [Mucilaginibacter gotjawali]